MFFLFFLGFYYVYKWINFVIFVYLGFIEICDFILGNRILYFKYVIVYDNEDDNWKIKVIEVNFNYFLDDLMIRGKY